MLSPLFANFLPEDTTTSLAFTISSLLLSSPHPRSWEIIAGTGSELSEHRFGYDSTDRAQLEGGHNDFAASFTVS